MIDYYQDYIWKGGLPKGVKRLQGKRKRGDSFRIVSDPYRKWITIERYWDGSFVHTPYDSRLLNFRKLHPADQHGWSREVAFESREKVIAFIRDHEERTLYKEVHALTKGMSTSCFIYCPNGILLAKHSLYYTSFGDPFNGVVLLDSLDKPVMLKRYGCNEEGQFTDLLEEVWDFKKGLYPPLR